MYYKVTDEEITVCGSVYGDELAAMGDIAQIVGFYQQHINEWDVPHYYRDAVHSLLRMLAGMERAGDRIEPVERGTYATPLGNKGDYDLMVRSWRSCLGWALSDVFITYAYAMTEDRNHPHDELEAYYPHFICKLADIKLELEKGKLQETCHNRIAYHLNDANSE